MWDGVTLPGEVVSWYRRVSNPSTQCVTSGVCTHITSGLFLTGAGGWGYRMRVTASRSIGARWIQHFFFFSFFSFFIIQAYVINHNCPIEMKVLLGFNRQFQSLCGQSFCGIGEEKTLLNIMNIYLTLTIRSSVNPSKSSN